MHRHPKRAVSDWHGDDERQNHAKAAVGAPPRPRGRVGGDEERVARHAGSKAGSKKHRIWVKMGGFRYEPFFS